MRLSALAARLLTSTLAVTFVIATIGASASAEDAIKHEAGRCAIRGQCGKKSVWSFKELPCPDNGLAKEPEKDTRKKLIEICGDKWEKGPICCDDDQLD